MKFKKLFFFFLLLLGSYCLLDALFFSTLNIFFSLTVSIISLISSFNFFGAPSTPLTYQPIVTPLIPNTENLQKNEEYIPLNNNFVKIERKTPTLSTGNQEVKAGL